ncbi:MAG: MOSC domain-containing protein [Candidatus Eremiobacteraeota bacterium]|nr:MOSC domain-containing protein [Candidatus Eremiobacteraeota bacterium]
MKSLAGEPLSEARLGRGGMPFDRQYVIIDGEASRKGKALTARIVADLLAYRATVDDGAVSVKGPTGITFGMDDGFLSHLQSAFGRPLSLQMADAAAEPFHDAHDILVLNAASVRALEHEWSKPLNPLRFRPNIMLDGDDLAPYVENDWVGGRFAVGEAILEGAELDERCVLPTIDPETQAKDPSFLRLIVEKHNQCFGLYCRVYRPGKIALGDEWTTLKL